MPKTPAPDAAPAEAPVEIPAPAAGGSYVFDPVTGTLVREGGTEPQTELTPNDKFDALQKKG